jgi:hypothetical protein
MNFTGGALPHLNPGDISITEDLQDPTGMSTTCWDASVLHSLTNRSPNWLTTPSEKAHIWYGTLQCDTSHFFCGPSSNNYVTSYVILRYLRD